MNNIISLPYQDGLPLNCLTAAFSDVTNSYKYYWFLAILEQIENKPNEPLISVEDLGLRMLSLVWHPLDFYKLSFGKQDGFKPIAELVSKTLKVNSSLNAKNLYQQFKSDLNPIVLVNLSKDIKKLIRYVPYRFQRPLLAEETFRLKDAFVNKTISILSDKYFMYAEGKVIYRFHEQDSMIELHPIWLTYFQRHIHILRGFIYFELVKFLQKNNPNVPGLSEKLFRPRVRDLKVATKLWEVFLRINPSYTCPFSLLKVEPNAFSLDHFIPWSYIVHDQAWNLLPIPKNVNSSKGNSLPSLSHYSEGFCSRQYEAFKFLLEANLANQNSLIEDYASLFGQDLNGLRLVKEEDFKKRLIETIKPIVQIAGNLGFRKEWIYK